MLLTIWAKLSYFLYDFRLYLMLISTGILLGLIASFKIYKSPLSQKKKKALISLVFSLILTLLIFSLFEGYFRYVYDESDGLGFLKVNKKWHERHIVFNNFYFRDRDFVVSKKEGVFRIGVLGDSIAQGEGIKDVNNRFSNLLEQKLKAAGFNTEVYNLGRAGYDTEGEIEDYQRVKHLDFDLIVWEYFINDIQPHGNSTGTPIIDKNSQRAKILKSISNQSYFLDFLYWRFSSVYNKTITALKTADVNQYKNPFVLARHKYNISGFIKSLKGENTKIVAVLFPSIMFLGENYPVFAHEIMLNHFKVIGVEVVDLYPLLKDGNPKQLRASNFDTHPNEIVHSLAADKLFEKVKTLLEN